MIWTSRGQAVDKPMSSLVNRLQIIMETLDMAFLDNLDKPYIYNNNNNNNKV